MGWFELGETRKNSKHSNAHKEEHELHVPSEKPSIESLVPDRIHI